jgi:hypothetical protein
MIPEFFGSVLPRCEAERAGLNLISASQNNRQTKREEDRMPDDAELSPEADDFFRTLPGDDYPQALVDQYPRIANTIVELRYERAKLENYFQSLLNDARGGRQGFPFSVLMNLQTLRDVMLGSESGTTFWV